MDDSWKLVEVRLEQVVVAAHHDDLMVDLARKIVNGKEEEHAKIARLRLQRKRVII